MEDRGRPAPQVVAGNGDEALQALDSGRGAGAKVLLRPVDGERFRVYLEGVAGEGRPLIPTPLELPGFPGRR
ncbi:hypothetical protein ACFYT4_32655 [Streptomyces sp. NPDC004609]|uniref:hypothetical protein n=1 Tax=Streptomyces sp. NPDC004609 TaxID=3364704 RepID=UPI0036D089C2